MAVIRDTWLDAQYSVLGSCLISPEVVPRVIHGTAGRDYSGPCLTVFEAIRKLFQSGEAVDVVSVANALGSEYREFLVQLMEVTPTAANIDHYIALCKEQSRMIAVRELARQMTEAENTGQLRALLEEAGGLMVEKTSLRITTMSDALTSFLERHSTRTEYLTWPVRELNDRIYAEPGDFLIIGGYPSSGKSAWALQCAWHWAKKYRVGFFSLETSSEKLFDRQMAAISGLSMDSIKRSDIDRKGWEQVCGLSTEITARKLELIPAAGMTAADVRAVTMLRRYQIIFVDYLQLLQGTGENRTAQVTSVSIALHTLAQSLGVTVVALSQLARQDPRLKNAAPDMSALRESGQIEQDADLIMLLSLEDRDKPEGNRILAIKKNKEGTCPSLLLAFDGRHQTFTKAGQTRQKLIHDGRKARHQTRQEQLTLLPEEAPVPF